MYFEYLFWCDRQLNTMADDFDIEAMLEETYRRQVGKTCIYQS